jgi:hypothetical protein
MQIQILDLDGAVTRQTGLSACRPIAIPLRDWGPCIRLGCSFGRFRRFTDDLVKRAVREEAGTPIFSFCGSGDFHHVSLALVSRLREPFNLLVIDNHPDWMRSVPLMHCGTWLYHAARLPQVQQIFHVGGDVDFDNGYRWLAPWPQLKTGKIVVIPARRTFGRGRWRHIGNCSLRPDSGATVTPGRLNTLLDPHSESLARHPLYISVDKDVLTQTESLVNWDSGHLGLADVLLIVSRFLAAAQGRLAGMDTVGDWSPVQVRGLFRRALHWTEHPPLTVDADEATRRNERVNLALLEAVRAT